MDDKTYPFFCEYCASIKYARPPKPKNDDPYVWQPTPQYICADCVRKLLANDNITNNMTEATDA